MLVRPREVLKFVTDANAKEGCVLIQYVTAFEWMNRPATIGYCLALYGRWAFTAGSKRKYGEEVWMNCFQRETD